MKQLYVVRHCSAEGQSADAPLTHHGLEQTNVLRDYLLGQSIELVVCSPFLRAKQTIEPFVRSGNVQMKVDHRVAERVLSGNHLPDWRVCLERTFEDLDLVYEGGESSRSAMQRVVEVVQEVLDNGPDRIAFVTHGNVMTLLLRHFDPRVGFNDWVKLSNPDVYLVDIDTVGTVVKHVWPH